MDEIFSRNKALLGEEKFNILKDSKILIVGLGGVGGYIAESLVRSGVGTVGLCDFDTVDISNINRQIFATQETVGTYKVDAAERRLLSINPELKVVKYCIKIDENSINLIRFDDFDFVADAIDDVPAKLLLIKACSEKIVCSMGTGNKMNPFGYDIVPIEKTSGDPLARSMRKKLKELNIKGVPVIYSQEAPVVDMSECTEGFIPSISYMPAIAGLSMSAYIIKQLTE